MNTANAEKDALVYAIQTEMDSIVNIRDKLGMNNTQILTYTFSRYLPISSTSKKISVNLPAILNANP